MAKTKLLAPSVRPGTVVEFMHGDQPQLAWVLEDVSGKLRLLTINKREMKLPSPRLLPWQGPCYDPEASRQDMLNLLVEHQERRGEIQAGLDVMEIWDMAQGELESAPLQWFAGLIWEDPGPDELAALGRAMLQAKTHFKFRPPDFDIRTAEAVDLRMAEEARAKSREAVTSAGQALFHSLWEARRAGRKPEIPAMEPEVAEALADILRQVMAGNPDEEAAKIWSAVNKGLPDHPHLALLLAQSWGVVEPHHNYLIDQAGYDWGNDWADPFSQDIEDLETASARDAAEPTDLRFVSIDAASTKDIDDAFHIEPEGDGYLLTLALARPTLHWNFGSELDQAVLNRATSLYLPEGTSHMLPESLGIGLYTLRQGELRPALVTEFRLDADGGLVSVTPRLDWVRVAENSTYVAAEQAIVEGSDASLILAHELAQKLLAARIESGGCIIRRPDPQIVLSGEGRNIQVEIEDKQECPASELLVSEFMILANQGLALWAGEHDIPLLHRTQDIALPHEAAGEFSKPEDIHRTVKLLLPPLLETAPKRHAALGVKAYAPITSPLRRYTDFINLAQVESFLNTDEPRLDRDELDHLAIHLGARIKDVSQVQRFRPRYWKLYYLAKHRRELQPAVLVEEAGSMGVLNIPRLQINVRVPKQMLGDKLWPGQRFQISFSRVDPLTNELRVAEALEE